VTWFKSDILLQNILVWLHCRKCSLKASNLWWQTFYLPVHVVFVGDKMMTNDPNWNHIICRPSIMVNLTCIICCATNISSLKILILMFQSVENGSSWVGLRKSLASIQSGWYKDMYKDSDGRICGSQWGIFAQGPDQNGCLYLETFELQHYKLINNTARTGRFLLKWTNQERFIQNQRCQNLWWRFLWKNPWWWTDWLRQVILEEAECRWTLAILSTTLLRWLCGAAAVYRDPAPPRSLMMDRLASAGAELTFKKWSLVSGKPYSSERVTVS